jgi:hypothetical protein
MKRRYAVFTVVFAISMLIGIQAVEEAEANPIPYPATPSPEKPTLTIETPQNGASYSNIDSLALNFSVAKPTSWCIDYDFFYNLGQITRIEVYLDGNLTSCPYDSTVIATNSPTCLTPPPANYSITLNHLTSGIHEANVTVQAYSFYTNPIYGSQNIPVNHTSLYQYPIVVSDVVYFTVEPPQVLILSPQTTTYNESSVSLIYSINEATSQIYYSLDGQKNTTDTGNSTFTDLSNGNHNVTVYATDVFGNIGSQTTAFTVEKVEPFPTVPVTAVVIAVVLAGTGVLVYFRRRRTL